MADVIIIVTIPPIGEEDPSYCFVSGWDGTNYSLSISDTGAKIFDDVSDATAISACEAAIISARGTESVPHTIPPPRPH